MADRRRSPLPPALHDDDPDAPPSEEELAASARLRDALDGHASADPATDADVALVASLRAAWAPGALPADEHAAIVDATPSVAELEAAERLRKALETGAPDHGDVLFATALRSAYAPKEIGAAEHRALVDAALRSVPVAPREAEVVSLARYRRRVARVAFGAAAAAAAIAASVVLTLTSQGHEAPLALAKARTTQPLFDAPFKPGESSARIDRIASARASDFRDNRFARWGVR